MIDEQFNQRLNFNQQMIFFLTKLKNINKFEKKQIKKKNRNLIKKKKLFHSTNIFNSPTLFIYFYSSLEDFLFDQFISYSIRNFVILFTMNDEEEEIMLNAELSTILFLFLFLRFVFFFSFKIYFDKLS